MRKGPGGSRRPRAAGSGLGAAIIATAPPGPGPTLGLWLRARLRRFPRAPGPVLAFAAAAALLYLAWPSGEPGTAPTPQTPLNARSEVSLRALLAPLNPNRLRDRFLRPLLHERIPGGSGSRAARQHIAECLSALRAAWHLEFDAFQTATPRGPVTFTNVVATVAPAAPYRLVLACHYDTKALTSERGHRVFVGATDSAVPCALLLELAAVLDRPLRRAKDAGAEVTLQLLFLDGEEAFEEWSPQDSLYGARHLAARMENARHGPGGTQLGAMSSSCGTWDFSTLHPKIPLSSASAQRRVPSRTTTSPSSNEAFRCCTSSRRLSRLCGTRWRTRKPTWIFPPSKTSGRSWWPSWLNSYSSEPPLFPFPNPNPPKKKEQIPRFIACTVQIRREEVSSLPRLPSFSMNPTEFGQRRRKKCLLVASPYGKRDYQTPNSYLHPTNANVGAAPGGVGGGRGWIPLDPEAPERPSGCGSIARREP
ncbi:glutaminyl-peptide cyclotransferase-like protein isoform X7 [Cuculus canorus]|uniref:glutaminyl-peptide cyclotransferase-like protein isoform X7 n=1 Tax=Cuculus canorus TaxID=55661 RepID=UPI0023AA4548|nr:glutaminyl-peptide cyclotransferase-like protein isoform X7 [Cuculus canorus]